MTNLTDLNPELLNSIRLILSEARTQLSHAVNKTIVHTYWHVGRLLIENEQHGAARASYGKQQVKILSKHLTVEFGKGFAFVARQQRISTEDEDFYIDLVFYNFDL